MYLSFLQLSCSMLGRNKPWSFSFFLSCTHSKFFKEIHMVIKNYNSRLHKYIDFICLKKIKQFCQLHTVEIECFKNFECCTKNCFNNFEDFEIFILIWMFIKLWTWFWECFNYFEKFVIHILTGMFQ